MRSVAMLSLTPTGTPASGSASSPPAMLTSTAPACCRAPSSSRHTMALSAPSPLSTASMRASAALVTSAARTSPPSTLTAVDTADSNFALTLRPPGRSHRVYPAVARAAGRRESRTRTNLGGDPAPLPDLRRAEAAYPARRLPLLPAPAPRSPAGARPCARVSSSALQRAAALARLPPQASRVPQRALLRPSRLPCLFPLPFQVRLRNYQCLAATLFVVEINSHLAVAARSGDFGNRAGAELPVPHARTNGDHGCVLRFVLGRRCGRLRPS